MVSACACGVGVVFLQGTTIYMLDASTGKLLRVLCGHTSTVTCLRMFDTGLGCPVAVSGSYDHTVCVWDLRCGALLNRLVGHTCPIWSVAVVDGAAQALTYQRRLELAGHYHLGTVADADVLPTTWVKATAPPVRCVPEGDAGGDGDGGGDGGGRGRGAEGEGEGEEGGPPGGAVSVESKEGDELASSVDVGVGVGSGAASGGEDPAARHSRPTFAQLRAEAVAAANNMLRRRLWVCSGDRDGNVIVWDVLTGSPLTSLSAGAAQVTAGMDPWGRPRYIVVHPTVADWWLCACVDARACSGH